MFSSLSLCLGGDVRPQVGQVLGGSTHGRLLLLLWSLQEPGSPVILLDHPCFSLSWGAIQHSLFFPCTPTIKLHWAPQFFLGNCSSWELFCFFFFSPDLNFSSQLQVTVGFFFLFFSILSDVNPGFDQLSDTRALMSVWSRSCGCFPMNVSNYGADLIICKCLFLVSPKIVLGSVLSWCHCQRLAQIPFLPGVQPRGVTGTALPWKPKPLGWC